MLDRSLELLLTDLVATSHPIDPTLLDAMLGSAVAGRRPANSTVRQLAVWIVGQASHAPTPSAVIALVTTLDAAGTQPLLHQAVARLQANPGSWAPAGSGVALWVPDDSPFVDRDGVRATLDAMARGEGPSVLAVDARYGEGKRTLAAYIGGLGRSTQAFQTVTATLRVEPRPGQLAMMVSGLRLRFGLPLAASTQGLGSTVASEEARAIAQTALGPGSCVWLVVHIMEPTGLEDGVLEFLDLLIGFVGSMPDLGHRLKIVVMADGVASLDIPNLAAHAGPVILPSVGEPEVRSWLERAVPGKQPEIYEFFATNVVTAADAQAAHLRLGFVAFHCADAHKTLLSLS